MLDLLETERQNSGYRCSESKFGLKQEQHTALTVKLSLQFICTMFISHVGFLDILLLKIYSYCVTSTETWFAPHKESGRKLKFAYLNDIPSKGQ